MRIDNFAHESVFTVVEKSKCSPGCDGHRGYILVFQSQHWEALEILWFAVKALSHFVWPLMYRASPVAVHYSVLLILQLYKLQQSKYFK